MVIEQDSTLQLLKDRINKVKFIQFSLTIKSVTNLTDSYKYVKNLIKEKPP